MSNPNSFTLEFFYERSWWSSTSNWPTSSSLMSKIWTQLIFKLTSKGLKTLPLRVMEAKRQSFSKQSSPGHPRPPWLPKFNCMKVGNWKLCSDSLGNPFQRRSNLISLSPATMILKSKRNQSRLCSKRSRSPWHRWKSLILCFKNHK